MDEFYGGLPPVGHCDGTVRGLKEMGRKAGIDHFIVHSVATKPEQVKSINAFISEAVQSSGGMFTGLGAMHPLSQTLEEDFAHLLELGLKGVKIHPDFQKFHVDDEKAFRIYELCEKNNVPVLVHTGDYRYDYSNPERVVNVLKTFPHLKFIGAHLGGWSVWERAKALLWGYPNLYVDTSSSAYWLNAHQMIEMIRAYGAEHVMFGSDYPMWHADTELAILRRLGLTQEEYDQICLKTCADLYHIK